MHQGQHPNCVLLDLVNKAIIFVRDYLARTRNPADTPILRMMGEPGGCLAEQFVHLDGGTRAVGSDVIEYLGAVVFRLGRPENFHDSVALLTTAVRRAANVASTFSFERPRPARIEARPASTLRWKY